MVLSSLDLKRGKSAVHMTSRIAHREIENKTNFFISFMWCPLGLGFFRCVRQGVCRQV